MLEFKIPQIPPSFNQLYQINYNFRCVTLSQQGRDFKALVKQYMPPYTPINTNSYYSIDISVYYNWYYKNGKLRKLDVQNLVKVLIDAIFEKLGQQDDNALWDIAIHKIQYIDSPYTMIKLWEIKNG